MGWAAMGRAGQCARRRGGGACSKCPKHGIGSCPCMLGMYTNYTACYISYTCTHKHTHSHTHSRRHVHADIEQKHVANFVARGQRFSISANLETSKQVPCLRRDKTEPKAANAIVCSACQCVCVCAACICCSPVLAVSLSFSLSLSLSHNNGKMTKQFMPHAMAIIEFN